MSVRTFWMVLYHVLWIVFVGTAALNMLHVRGGFFTNYVADIVAPAWLYVVSRGLHPPRDHKGLLQQTIGRTPEIAAVTLFLASAATEISQRFWPTGIFAGRFDILDVAAFASGLAACYAAEKLLSAKRAALAA